MPTTQLVTVIYAAVIHLSSVIAITILMANGSVTMAAGLPILAGLFGLGAGAGAALIVPGLVAMPSGAPGQTSSSDSAAPVTNPAPLAPLVRSGGSPFVSGVSVDPPLS